MSVKPFYTPVVILPSSITQQHGDVATLWGADGIICVALATAHHYDRHYNAIMIFLFFVCFIGIIVLISPLWV